MVDSFLPSNDRRFLTTKGYSFREVNDGANKGLIIDNFLTLPEKKYNQANSSLLVILPTGYPDVPPDMFYFQPALTLAVTNSYPAYADVMQVCFQQTWQRWSRHAPTSDWRVGKDGIHSYIQRVLMALNTAI